MKFVFWKSSWAGANKPDLEELNSSVKTNSPCLGYPFGYHRGITLKTLTQDCFIVTVPQYNSIEFKATRNIKSSIVYLQVYHRHESSSIYLAFNPFMFGWYMFKGTPGFDITKSYLLVCSRWQSWQRATHHGHPQIGFWTIPLFLCQ